MIDTLLNMDALLAPIPGDNPSGEDLRYDGVYEEIKEARRSDEVLDQGAWETEVKKADWDKVIEVAAHALGERTKDIQIAIWLTEALIKKAGFGGLAAGLSILGTLINDYWDTIYPLPDEGDLEYRIGPLEFLNEKISLTVRDAPLTNPKTSGGYSWLKWQESRQGGGEGKLPAEEFDAAVNKSSRDFYLDLAGHADASLEAFSKLDAVLDEKFGREAPGLSEMKKAIEDCRDLVNTVLEQKGGRPAGDIARAGSEGGAAGASADGGQPKPEPSGSPGPAAGQAFIPAGRMNDQGDYELAVWNDALETFKGSGIKTALEKLLNASCSATSVRQHNRYRLMMANLALKAKRPEISRPILEELYALIIEFRLEQWESPLWIAEVIETYYQCLTADGASDEDIYKANSELYPKLCSKDITKALQYKKGG